MIKTIPLNKLVRSPRNVRRTSDAARAAATLSRLEQQALSLSAVEGLDNEVMAARLGLSRNCTEQLLARAIAKFDRALGRGRRS